MINTNNTVPPLGGRGGLLGNGGGIYESTGNIAVDMVAGCVAWHRTRNLPVKTIYLNWYYYNKFDYYVRSKLNDEQASLPQRYEFDNVNIERSPIRISKPLEVVMWHEG